MTGGKKIFSKREKENSVYAGESENEVSGENEKVYRSNKRKKKR